MKAMIKPFNKVFAVKKKDITLTNYEKINDNDPLISIIVPLYNEENSILNVLSRIPNHFRYEIIIVDDGSTDNSISEISKVNDKNIKILKHDENKGYGTALKTGIMNCKGDIIVTMDSDGQHDPQEIPLLVRPIIKNQADLCIGSRYWGDSNYKIPLHTRIGEYFIDFMLWMLFNQRVGNNQNGFRAFRRELSDLIINIKNEGMGFTTELLFEFAYRGLKIVEIPIKLNNRKFGKSNVKLITVTKSIMSCMIKYMLKKIHLNEKIIKRIEKWIN